MAPNALREKYNNLSVEEKMKLYDWLKSQQKWHEKQPQTEWHKQQARWYKNRFKHIFDITYLVAVTMWKRASEIAEHVQRNNGVLARVLEPNRIGAP